jgi:hypothetical protein
LFPNAKTIRMSNIVGFSSEYSYTIKGGPSHE